MAWRGPNRVDMLSEIIGNGAETTDENIIDVGSYSPIASPNSRPSILHNIKSAKAS